MHEDYTGCYMTLQVSYNNSFTFIRTCNTYFERISLPYTNKHF